MIRRSLGSNDSGYFAGEIFRFQAGSLVMLDAREGSGVFWICGLDFFGSDCSSAGGERCRKVPRLDRYHLYSEVPGFQPQGLEIAFDRECACLIKALEGESHQSAN